MQVIEAGRSVVGRRELRQLWRRAMLHTFEQPTLRVLVQGAKKLFGMSPHGMIRAAPRGWGLLTREIGTLEARDTEGSQRATLVLQGFPPEHSLSGTFVEGLAGCFESFFDVCKVSGRVAVTEQDADTGSALYDLSWE